MIQVDNLTKRYGKKTAVDDLTFTVQPGMVTGFLGPNGSGIHWMRGLLRTLAAEGRTVFLFVFPLLVTILHAGLSNSISPYLPGNAGRAIMSITPQAHALSPWRGSPSSRPTRWPRSPAPPSSS